MFVFRRFFQWGFAVRDCYRSSPSVHSSDFVSVFEELWGVDAMVGVGEILLMEQSVLLADTEMMGCNGILEIARRSTLPQPAKPQQKYRTRRKYIWAVK